MYFKRLTFILVMIFYSLPAFGELIKPNNGIEPIQVVKIQLRGLMNNDEPKKDSGIEQTREFAHPNNQRYTGPLDKFKSMLKGKSYSMLLNHKEHKVDQVYLTNEVAMYEVTIMDEDKMYYNFQWTVE